MLMCTLARPVTNKLAHLPGAGETREASARRMDSVKLSYTVDPIGSQTSGKLARAADLRMGLIVCP